MLGSVFVLLAVHTLIAALLGLVVGALMVAAVEWVSSSKERYMADLPDWRLDALDQRPEWDRTGSEQVRKRLDSRKGMKARWSGRSEERG